MKSILTTFALLVCCLAAPRAEAQFLTTIKKTGEINKIATRLGLEVTTSGDSMVLEFHNFTARQITDKKQGSVKYKEIKE